MYNCKEFTFHLSGSALDVIFLIDCEENITTGILQTVTNQTTLHTSPKYISYKTSKSVVLSLPSNANTYLYVYLIKHKIVTTDMSHIYSELKHM